MDLIMGTLFNVLLWRYLRMSTRVRGGQVPTAFFQIPWQGTEIAAAGHGMHPDWTRFVLIEANSSFETLTEVPFGGESPCLLDALARTQATSGLLSRAYDATGFCL